MNKDDLFDYLVATDELDDFLGYEPKCPNCGKKMVKIIYGMPSSDIFEKAEDKEVYLGGCERSDNDPKYHCYKCNRNYYDNLEDYIDTSDLN